MVALEVIEVINGDIEGSIGVDVMNLGEVG